MPDNLLNAISGLSSSDLALTTATINDVLSGKTFYSGDDTIKTGVASWIGNDIATVVNANNRATSWSGSVTGHTRYVYCIVCGDRFDTNNAFSVSNGTVTMNHFITTNDYDDGSYRCYGRVGIITANSPSNTVGINATLGNSYYGSGRIIIIGL